MRSSYKRMGDYIRKVDNRNKDVLVTDLRGLSMTKEFRKSTSNIVGTDLSKYKVVQKWQFACDFMSPIRVFKLPVVLHTEDEPVIVSPAYPVFEIVDHNKLHPEYLMMWMRRSEFDRYVFFRCDSAIRGGFGWEELCDVALPVPTIEKQREIVREYHTIVHRIKLNEQLNQKLEETAQAIYKQWFVDFEFPMSKEHAAKIGKPELEGKPYKSSGGKMVWNDELDQEIPEGSTYELLGENLKLSQGQVINAKTNYLIQEEGIPLLRIQDLQSGEQVIFLSTEVPTKNIATKDDIIYTRTGKVGLVFKNKEGVVHNNCFKVIASNEKVDKGFLFWFLKSETTYQRMTNLASGSAQPDLSHKVFLSEKWIRPSTRVQKIFSNHISKIDTLLDLKFNGNILLNTFADILLSKMTKAEAIA